MEKYITELEEYVKTLKEEVNALSSGEELSGMNYILNLIEEKIQSLQKYGYTS